MSQRQLRVAELVQREVSLILRQKWTAEAALITITRASVSPDLIFTEDDVTGGVARVQSMLDELARQERPTKDSPAD